MTQSRWQEGGRGEHYISPPRKSSLLGRPAILFILVFLLIGFGFLVWWGYDAFLSQKQSAEIPVIYPEEGPYKVRPEDPHTHKIPHKEKTIYEHLSRQKVEKKEIKLRSLPKDPKEQGPTLPVDFVQAFSDQVTEEPQNLAGGESPTETSQESPFVEESGSSFSVSDNKYSPLAEKEGFFNEGDSRTEFETVSGQASELEPVPSSFAKDIGAGYPSKVSSCDQVVCTAYKGTSTFSSLEFFQSESEKEARQVWKWLQKMAPDLLAAQKVSFRKIDHGRKTGIRYHVTVSKLSEEQISTLQKSLAERGIKTSLFPS